MKIALVGATGLVGSKMLEILQERKFPVSELILVATEKSLGNKINFYNKEYEVVNYETALTYKPQLALFSAGAFASLQLTPLFANIGCTVIDNSSAWRMDVNKKLIVPEVNAHVLSSQDKIIANPNCSTIQMVVVLYPLHKKYKIKRVVVSTYQSVSGTGVKAVTQLMNERANTSCEKAYPHPIDLNILPHIDLFLENGNTKEEMKMILETKKIMGDESIRISATTVRVPVIVGHSESVNIEFENDFEVQEVRDLLENSEGITVLDDVKNNQYPMPLFAQGNDEVFVGRIRRDESQLNTLNCWIVSDNLRKGAATNAIQIAEYLLQKGYL